MCLFSFLWNIIFYLMKKFINRKGKNILENIILIRNYSQNYYDNDVVTYLLIFSYMYV